MSLYRLDKAFVPRSVALVGASPRERSVGRALLKNLIAGGFAGPIRLVNPHYAEIEGIAAVRRIEDLPEPPDLIVIASPPATVPEMVRAAGAKGCAAAVIITAGMGHGAGSFAEAARNAARAHGLRLIGPNCLGVLVPRIGLNASFAARLPQQGDLALISQSGAIVAGLVEWAARRKVGFSTAVSLGDQVDVDFADLLDFFAMDGRTRAILLYVEAVKDARKFMSAARAASRVKPVVVVKAGRHAQGALAAATHTGALAGTDAVYEAAFRRAGLLRVLDLDQLFAAAETLGRVSTVRGPRLAILTNGGGLGVLAVDRLTDLGGELADLSEATMQRLGWLLPSTWSKANPVDIAGDADAARYTGALEALLADPANDAVLVMNVPTALASGAESGAAVVEAVRSYRARVYPGKPVFAVWVGGDVAAASAFGAAGIPSFPTEGDAVGGFMHLVRYRQALAASMETPPSLPVGFTPDVATARRIVRGAIERGCQWLDPIEISALFEAYAIPIAPVLLARDAAEAVAAAKPFLAEGQAVVVKILSPDIVHKSDVGGVRLNLTSQEAVHAAATDILARARAARPDARITGLTIHPMLLRPKARELIAGIADDPTFGPVIVFGRGGTAVEVINDRSLALPPLDLKLANDLIRRTRVSRILDAYRNVRAVDRDALAFILVKIAQLAADLPEVRELDINPLLADEKGIIAVDARAAIAPLVGSERGSGHPRFAVRPYPQEWERHATLPDGRRVFIRPVRPEDEALYEEFFRAVSDEDLRLRFFGPIKIFSHAFIARLTQLDYARAMAFLVIDEATGQMLGAVRLHADPDYVSGEYAVMVRSDLKGQGLGWLLMETIIAYARREGVKSVEGHVLRANATMLEMCRQLGFTVTDSPEDKDICYVTLRLAE